MAEGHRVALHNPPPRPMSLTLGARLGTYEVVALADGQKFLVNTVTEQAAPTPITVVVNWTATLRK